MADERIFTEALDRAEREVFKESISVPCQVCELSGSCGLETQFKESRYLGLTYDCKFFGNGRGR